MKKIRSLLWVLSLSVCTVNSSSESRNWGGYFGIDLRPAVEAIKRTCKNIDDKLSRTEGFVDECKAFIEEVKKPIDESLKSIASDCKTLTHEAVSTLRVIKLAGYSVIIASLGLLLYGLLRLFNQAKGKVYMKRLLAKLTATTASLKRRVSLNSRPKKDLKVVHYM